MGFDMREMLFPKRLTIAMWDAAYMARRNVDDPFHDWDRCLDELVERRFNTIRIDAFPDAIDPKDLDKPFTFPKTEAPFSPWMWYRACDTRPGRDLIEFINKAAERGLYLTLSSWWACLTADLSAERATERWIALLEVIKRECGFEHILFTDLCNEIPGFLAGYEKNLKAIGNGNQWNEGQLAFLKSTLDGALKMAQEAYPEMRFTFSMNINEQFEKVGFQHLDVLDVHLFLSDARFNARTQFNDFVSKAYKSTDGYRNFSDRCKKAMDAVGPGLRQKQRQQIKWAAEFSQKIGAPLVTTEAWASWFYLDHPDLDWRWLIDWCDVLIDDAIEFGLWGITTNNYAEPHFELWKDVAWHQRVNGKFLDS